MDWIETLLVNMIIASRRHRVRDRLSKLTDRHLRDIGLERDDIPSHVAATIPRMARPTACSAVADVLHA